jgi:outer membrane immunogenic protein
MKLRLTTACAMLAMVAGGAANAADLPVRPAPPRAPVFVAPVYNWTGFYIGINGGGAWAHKCWDFLGVAGFVREGCHSPDGGLFGGQVGFNWQTGAFVFGVEFAGDWASLTGSNNSLVFVAPLNVNRSRIDALASFTGRVGYAWDAALLYAKGGGAWVDDKYDARIALLGVTATATESRGGWTVGGGFEYGFAPNWSFGVEYMHYDFGNKNVTFGGPGAGVDRIDQTVDAVTARINWRFGWGGPVVARY